MTPPRLGWVGVNNSSPDPHRFRVQVLREGADVTVSVTAAGDAVTGRVADNGPGVPDEEKEAVFEKGETGLESSGTGIGLYLARTLVENYGGGIGIEDTEPEGAVFVVNLRKGT